MMSRWRQKARISVILTSLTLLVIVTNSHRFYEAQDCKNTYISQAQVVREKAIYKGMQSYHQRTDAKPTSAKPTCRKMDQSAQYIKPTQGLLPDASNTERRLGANSLSNVSITNLRDKTTLYINTSHIVYIKTHKAASSTIQSILMRYGMNHNLTFATPPRNKTEFRNQLGWPDRFEHKRHMSKETQRPDILCYHSVLSTDLIETVPADSFYMTSLRDPFTQLMSTYQYYRVDIISNRTMMDWIIGPSKISSVDDWKNNPQMLDLGLSVDKMDDTAQIMKHVHTLDALLNFVIIVEYFEECLILLCDKLNWTMRDILYFKVNFAGKKTQSQPKKHNTMLPEDNVENRKLVYQYVKADFILYSYFKKKVEKTISRNQDYLDAEIVKLREMQKIWMDFCIKDSVPAGKINDGRFKTYGRGSYGYVLTEQGLQNSTCIELASAELFHVKLVAEYQAKLLGLDR